MTGCAPSHPTKKRSARRRAARGRRTTRPAHPPVPPTGRTRWPFVPSGEVRRRDHPSDLEVRRARRADRGHRQRRADQERRMARELPAPIMQIRSRPCAPQAELTATAGGETLDARQRVVPVGRRAGQDGAVEVAARTAEIGHRDVVGIEGAPATGQREGGIERGEVEHEAAQQRVGDVDVALPAGHQVLFGPHGIDNDGLTSHDRCTRVAPRRSRIARRRGAGPSVVRWAIGCSGQSSWSTPTVTPARSAAPANAPCSQSSWPLMATWSGWTRSSTRCGRMPRRPTAVHAAHLRVAPARPARSGAGGPRRRLRPRRATRRPRRRPVRNTRRRRPRAEAAEAADLLAAALDLWHGPAYGDCADVERVRAEARRLEERREGHGKPTPSPCSVPVGSTTRSPPPRPSSPPSRCAKAGGRC